MRSLLRRLSIRSNANEEALVFCKGPLEGVSNTWCEVSGTSFQVRGKNYLSDRRKQPSRENAFELIEVEVFNSQSGKQEHYAANPESALARARAEGDKRFFLVVTFQTMSTHLVATWAVNDESLADDPPALRAWQRYIQGHPEHRSARLKVIPRVVDGNIILRRLVGEKPGILGRKLQFRYHVTNDHLEVVCDTASTAIATRITSACMDQAARLSIDLAFVIEGTQDDELPERILGAFRMNKPNLSNARVI